MSFQDKKAHYGDFTYKQVSVCVWGGGQWGAENIPQDSERENLGYTLRLRNPNSFGLFNRNTGR